MPITENNLILGATKYLTMYDESTWGVRPASPTYFHIPVTDYNVKFTPVNRQANPYIGEYQRMHNQNYKGMPSGTMVLPLYGFHLPSMGKSIAQYILDWAFGDYELIALTSKGAEWAEGPNVANKRHHGLRVNSATLSGSEDTGFIGVSLELQGQSEDGEDILVTAQTLPANRFKLVDFEYCGSAANADTTFFLGADGTEPIYPKSFQIQIQNGLKAEYLNSFNPSLLPKTQRVVTMQVVLPKNSDTYDAFRRLPNATELVGQFLLKGLHMGTGTNGTNWSQAQIDMPRCSYVNHTDQGGIADLAFQPLDFVLLKPQTSSNDITFTWTDVS